MIRVTEASHSALISSMPGRSCLYSSMRPSSLPALGLCTCCFLHLGMQFLISSHIWPHVAIKVSAQITTQGDLPYPPHWNSLPPVTLGDRGLFCFVQALESDGFLLTSRPNPPCQARALLTAPALPSGFWPKGLGWGARSTECGVPS